MSESQAARDVITPKLYTPLRCRKCGSKTWDYAIGPATGLAQWCFACLGKLEPTELSRLNRSDDDAEPA